MDPRGWLSAPRIWWLVAPILLVALALVLVATQVGNSDGDSPDEASEADTADDGVAGLASPFSVSQAGGDITVTGSVPDDAAKRALLTGLAAGIPPPKITDQIEVDPEATAPDPEAFGELAEMLYATRADASVDWDGESLTLMGTARDADTSLALEDAALRVVPDTNQIHNRIAVSAPSGPQRPTEPAEPPTGCQGIQVRINDILARNKIRFVEESAVLTEVSTRTISKVEVTLQSCPKARVEVGGHTDNQGSRASSAPLSLARARSVKAELVANGVAPGRIEVKGYGESRPIASNATKQGRAENRRVEIVVL